MMTQSTPALFAELQSTVPCPDDVSTPCRSVPLVQTFVSAAETVPIRSAGSLVGAPAQAAITDPNRASGIEARRMSFFGLRMTKVKQPVQSFSK